ncbi:MAG: T9SS type A sorting domain-containing protein [Bacteroidota bacterium]
MMTTRSLRWYAAIAALLMLQSVLYAQLIELKDSIQTDLKLDSTKQYLLKGFFKVKAPATLTIPAGTVIYGDKDSKGSLIIERGAKIMAIGTATHPIVFTSSKPPGQRNTGDWGGVLIAGNASINVPGGVATFEGGVGVQYGGGATPNDDDNSGVMRYVRIEYSGIPFAPNSEINGLTMGGVGRGTTLEYIMVTRNGDDSFEWFGGTVNAKYLISNQCVDDDFDTDFGFRGKLQYLIGLRNPNIADVSASHAMEADNDASGSLNTPRSNPTISNATFVGPMKTTSSTDYDNVNFKRAAHWRRSTQYGLHNSIILGWPLGIFIDGKNTATAAQGDTLTLRNSILAGIKNNKYFDTTSSNGTFDVNAWGTASAKGNTFLAEAANVQLTDPFNLTTPNFMPQAGSPALSGADFSHPRVADQFFTATTFRGAIGNSDWTANWAVWNPQNIVYTSPYTVTSVRELTEIGTPSNYTLAQNYPNPFNPSTVINFSLPVSGFVTVKVYDVVGREIATLVNGFQQAGSYAVDFDATGLAGGVYLYRLTAGSFSQVKKMMLVK